MFASRATAHSRRNATTSLQNQSFPLTPSSSRPAKAKGCKLRMTFPIRFGDLVIPWWLARYPRSSSRLSPCYRTFSGKEKGDFALPNSSLRIPCQRRRSRRNGLPGCRGHYKSMGFGSPNGNFCMSRSSTKNHFSSLSRYVTFVVAESRASSFTISQLHHSEMDSLKHPFSKWPSVPGDLQ